MMGRRPYLGRSRQEIRDQILAKQVQVKKQEVPPNWSLEAADFANRVVEQIIDCLVDSQKALKPIRSERSRRSKRSSLV
jgi:hypothetical protein